MESSLHIREVMQVLSFICLCWKSDSYAEAGNIQYDADSTGGLNQNYFFYHQYEYPRDCQDVLRGCPSLNVSGVYLIKPDGYPEPFEVYCDSNVSSSGWTVVQRRVGDFVTFNRLWEDYKEGFGFLSHEFWLGLEKLSHLTNQAVYELRVDLELSDGSSFYVTYSGFRISDEWSKYAVVTLGEYYASGDSSITSCPRYMNHGNCTCTGTCDEPSGSTGCNSDCNAGTEGCFCPDGFLMNGDECVPPSECPCFWSEIDQVIPSGQTRVNDDCTEKRTCTNEQLVHDGGHQCSSNAQCTVHEGVRQCYCNDGFQGDGQNCDVIYTDCYDAYTAGHEQDGVYLIKPTDWPGSAFNVSCVMSTNGGGWTVFQRRTGIDRQTNFYRNWTSYRDGFGSSSGDFWLGNEKLHYLTSQKSYKFRVDMVGSSNSAIYLEYCSARLVVLP